MKWLPDALKKLGIATMNGKNMILQERNGMM
jgi:hypothetical protein